VKAKAIEFRGSCAGCGRAPKNVRGAVEVSINRHGDYEWICLGCALKLANKLIQAVVQCRSKLIGGFMYRNDRWQKKQ
jgi:hypothetical protein